MGKPSAAGRSGVRLGDIQGHLGAALGGEPGARLAKRLGMTVSGDTLLRLVRHQAPATSTLAPSGRSGDGGDAWPCNASSIGSTLHCPHACS